jgi:deazaflavin-dependent oxidoreductase (nitroreductase family)
MNPSTSSPERGATRSRTRRLALLGGPSTRPISGKRWFPLYGTLHHVGRKSGREYATPVVVRGTSEGTYVPLPFGVGTDWYRNAVAAGGVRATWRGSDLWLAHPTVVDRGDAARAFNPLMRGLMRFAGIELVVRFDGLDQAAVD